MQFKSLFVFASFPVLLFAQTSPTEIESEISNVLGPAATADLAAIDAFPVNGGTADEATAIHDANTNLNTVILTLMSDIDVRDDL
ncbi:hypothetical protein C0992_012514 [Termitomyces sp. T32_za158]|nr:hypothetical protein C0992_012514 [Termitomyces sp. T32_za158]